MATFQGNSLASLDVDEATRGRGTPLNNAAKGRQPQVKPWSKKGPGYSFTLKL